MRLFALIVISAALPCFANTYIVDQNGFKDFTGIQEAINYSWHGDTVIVNPGIYNENIYFNGRAITLTSTNPNDLSIVEATIINPSSGHSVTFDFGEDTDSILTGFTITASVYCYGTLPTITKNVIKNCNFGIYCWQNAQPIITKNIIEHNTRGIYRCNGLIKNNIISGNHSYYDGAGLCECEGSIINNVIIGNYADSDGGGIYQCNALVKNNIIAFNRADSGGGIYGNCQNSYNAFWDNLGDNLRGGALAGQGDIVINPLFALDGYWDDPCNTPNYLSDDIWINGDYHLKSTAGRWTGTGWVFDDVNSPCIDAGDPNDSIGIEPNPNGGRINIGAYGGTEQASKSPSGIIEPICTEYPVMDFNKDCKVDFWDFATFTQSWLECNLEPPESCWE